MKTNPVKQKLRAGQPSFGTWLSLGNLHAARVLARSGFDWLTLDMEHSAIDWSQAAAIFAAVADAGCVPLCRVPEGNHHLIKRALDAGAWGIVAPMIESVEQAKTVIAAAKYPPFGNRSVGGGMHALNFAASAGEYYERANDEILVILQTESPKGVDHAEAIYALPGCDAIFIGPNDLRFNMRTLDGHKPTDAEAEALIAQVVAIGQKVGMPTGIHAMDAQEALRRAEQGMQFIAVASDLRMMNLTAQDYIKTLYRNEAAKDLARY
jgi:4-hydroxy-2-oxoheptanedioate aldolase